MPDFDSAYVDSIDDIVGHSEQITYLERFASDVDNGARRKPLLIYGPPGTGKTATSHMLAAEHGWNLVEMSASDYRDAESIASMLHVSSNTRSLFGKINMLLLDEVDELSGKHDEGAAGAINKLIGESKSPIILIANDMWNRKIAFLRGKTDNVEFKRLRNDEVAAALRNAAKRIGADLSPNVIDGIASRAAGDARSALNDLIVMVGSDDEMLESIGMRDRKSDIFSVLDKIFQSNTLAVPLKAMASSDVDNEMLMKWIDENLPHRYLQKEDLRDAYRMLAMASGFNSRASRSQYYTYWRYMNVMMSSGVALSKSSYPDSRMRYSFPKVISSLSGTKESRGLQTELAKKLQKKVHMSIKEIKSSVLPLLSSAANLAVQRDGSESVYDFFASRFDMTDNEVKGILAIRG